MSDAQESFLLTEAEQLRTQILNLAEARRTLERYAIVSYAAIYTWTISYQNDILDYKTNNDIDVDSILIVSWFIPVVFSIVGFFRSFHYLREISNIGQYLKTKEIELGVSGWEIFRRFEELTYKNLWKRVVTEHSVPSGLLFWVMLTILTLSTALLANFGIRSDYYDAHIMFI